MIVSIRKLLVTLLLTGALPVAADESPIRVGKVYVTSAYDTARSAAVYVELTNGGSDDDRLLGIVTDIAVVARLHQSAMRDGGVMSMSEMDEGLVLPSGQTVELIPGGVHVMLMGVNRPLVQSAEIMLELTFENADPIVLSVPVDRSR